MINMGGGLYALSSSLDGQIKLYDVMKSQEIQMQIKQDNYPVNCIQVIQTMNNNEVY